MQLSTASGALGLIQRTTFLTFGNEADHTSQYSLAAMTTSLNEWVNRVGTWIWATNDTWEYDDTNATDIPIATTTLVDNQSDYSMPTNLISIERVEVLDINGITWRRLKAIDLSEVRESVEERSPLKQFPREYDIYGNSIMLYPAPDTTLVTAAAGLKIYFGRTNGLFSVPATYTTVDTTVPGFQSNFHDIVCYGAAIDWIRANNSTSPKLSIYERRLDILKTELTQQYGNKDKDLKVAIHPRMETYR